MIDDRDPYWGRRYGLSSQELGELKRKWTETGRQLWGAATRAGQDVKARTESELEALGRSYLAQAEQEKASAVALARTITGPPSDPTPAGVVAEWATGAGPRTHNLNPDSRFSREFVQAPSVQANVRQATEYWRRRDGGKGALANYRGVFRYPGDPLRDGFNGASQVVGSYRLDGQRKRDEIEWTARNRMGLHSLFAGRKLDELGLPSAPNLERPFPGGTTEQVIRFQTDLEGRPKSGR